MHTFYLLTEFPSKHSTLLCFLRKAACAFIKLRPEAFNSSAILLRLTFRGSDEVMHGFGDIMFVTYCYDSRSPGH